MVPAAASWAERESLSEGGEVVAAGFVVSAVFGAEQRYHREGDGRFGRWGVGVALGIEAVDFGVEDEDGRSIWGQGVAVVAVGGQQDYGGAGGGEVVVVGGGEGVLV